MDSNFQYAEAVKLVVAPFSCAGRLGRVAAPVGVLRFSSFFMSGKPLDGAWLLRHRFLAGAAKAAKTEPRLDKHTVVGIMVLSSVSVSFGVSARGGAPAAGPR